MLHVGVHVWCVPKRVILLSTPSHLCPPSPRISIPSSVFDLEGHELTGRNSHLFIGHHLNILFCIAGDSVAPDPICIKDPFLANFQWPNAPRLLRVVVPTIDECCRYLGVCCSVGELENTIDFHNGTGEFSLFQFCTVIYLSPLPRIANIEGCGRWHLCFLSVCSHWRD